MHSPRCRLPTLVNQNDDDGYALTSQLRHQCVDGGNLVLKLKSSHTGRHHHAGRIPQGKANESDLDPVQHTNIVRRKQSFPRGFDSHVGSKIVKFGANKLALIHTSVASNDSCTSVMRWRVTTAIL